MMNSERFIALIIALNILIGIATTGYNLVYDSNTRQEITQEDITREMISQSSSENTLYEGTTSTSEFADRNMVGKMTQQTNIFYILWNALNPFSVTGIYTDETMDIIAWTLGFFRLIVDIIASILLYKLIVNKAN